MPAFAGMTVTTPEYAHAPSGLCLLATLDYGTSVSPWTGKNMGCARMNSGER
jgi:NAD(P)H-dependent FMN reductase